MNRQGVLTVMLWAVVVMVAQLAVAAHAEEVVISDDGRQIQLKGDGTWVQLSRDRFATNAQGQRIRLKADGTWTLMTEVEASSLTQTPASAPLTPIQAASESTLHLANVEILRRKIKRSKSVHAEIRTRYHVSVLNDSNSTIDLSGRLDRMLKARSSSGGTFEILGVNAEVAQLAPGERANIVVEAEGAPQWFGVKYMQLEVAAGALGNSDRRILSKSMAEVKKRSVERF